MELDQHDTILEQEKQDQKDILEFEVHLRIQQRTTRKSYTIIEEMPFDIDLRKVVKAFKKILNCNGTVKKEKHSGKEIIQLQGDQRKEVRDFLITQGIVKAEEIKVHS